MSVCSQNLQSVIEKLRSRKQTVGFGESCTGGLLSATLTTVAGVSDIFLGSVVSYAYQAKVDLLDVSWDTLKQEGAVSENVARQMAQGVRKKLKCDWSVAVTGIAGPTGGTEEKPVGTVWFSVSGPGFDTAAKEVFPGSRADIQKAAVEYATSLLLKSMG